jgi:hypothetical protein
VNQGVLFWTCSCESCCFILNQWLWIIVCYAEQLVVNHGDWYWASGYESLCVNPDSYPMAQHSSRWFIATGSTLITMILTHWLTITHHDSQPLAHYKTTWFTTIGSAYLSMIQIHWIIITHHVSQPLAQHNSLWLWILCLILHQRLWIIVCYAEQLVVNHGVLCWASGYESWWLMLRQWWWIIGHNHWLIITQHVA